jgi:hypothetical protein
LEDLQMRTKLVIAAALLGSTLTLASAPADARWWGHHGGWGYGAAGFAAGALIGSAIASRPYYYDYGYDGPPAYAYAPGPAYPDGDEAYCESRFRSYDPASGTYVGYDGRRHPCP